MGVSAGEEMNEERKVRIRTLMVPSVQEMAENKEHPLVSVPARYVQTEPPSLEGDLEDATLGVPVIDMEALFKGDPVQLHGLHSACKHWGFFVAVKHGVSETLIESMKREVKALFEMPMEEKKKLWQTPEEAQGFGQTFVVSEEQSFDWSDIFFMATHPALTSRKPHLYPNLPLPFKDAMESYVTEVRIVADKIMASLGEALVQAGYTKNMPVPICETGLQALKINYYPSCPEPHKVIGISPHSDANLVSILLQLDETDGLQINKDGSWLPVHPLPQSFIVNIGDMMEILSNGIYRSVEHRVVVNKKKERISVALFHSVKIDQEFGPLSSLIGPQNPAKFMRTMPLEYLKCFFAHKLEGKCCLDLFRVDHSHQLANDVTPILHE